jgi:hypothetical protein
MMYRMGPVTHAGRDRFQQGLLLYTVSREVLCEHTEELTHIRLGDADDNGSIVALHKWLRFRSI